MIKQLLKYYKWRLLNPIIPCAVCKVPGCLLICNHCYSELEINQQPQCNYCAKPGTILCSSCSKSRPAFSHTYCRYTYSTPLNKMLHQLKYKYDKSNLWALGYLLSHILATVKSDTDLILPMPQSSVRQAQRGFNQAYELLCYYQTTSSHLQIKTNLVTKTVDTPHQTSLNLANRKHLHNIYTVEKNIKDKNILIVDDVITTGGTANNLATALKLAGAKRIELCVLLRTI